MTVWRCSARGWLATAAPVAASHNRSCSCSLLPCQGITNNLSTKLCCLLPRGASGALVVLLFLLLPLLLLHWLLLPIIAAAGTILASSTTCSLAGLAVSAAGIRSRSCC